MSDQAKNDQTKFWIHVAQGISENLASAVSTERNLILVNGDLPCVFDKDANTAQSQMYQIANKILPWSLTWDGSSGDNLFRQYQAFVNDIAPDPAVTGAEADKIKTELDAIQDQIIGMSDKVGSLLKRQIKQYLDDYCISPDASGFGCNKAIPGAPNINDYIMDYKKSPEYKTKVTALEREYSDSLAGLQTKYDRLATEYYGDNYQQLNEAATAVAKADPNDLIDSDPSYQMKVSDQAGTISYEPLFESSQMAAYKEWLSKTKAAYDNSDDPSVQISFNNKIDIKDETKWSFATNAVIPVDFFFQANVSVSGQGDQVDMSKYQFEGVLTYQDIIQIDVSPSDKWFFSNLFKLYSDYFTDHKSSVFKGKTLWGPNGLLSNQVKSVIIGYGSYLKMTSDNWSQSDYYLHVHTSTSFGIGPIHFASATTDTTKTHHKVTQSGNGIEVQDTSGQAKIIGVILDTPNF